MLRLSEYHAVAIYLRDGVVWVADFIDGQGALVDANTWFRFNCGNLDNSHALRRMALGVGHADFRRTRRADRSPPCRRVHRRGQTLSDLARCHHRQCPKKPFGDAFGDSVSATKAAYGAIATLRLSSQSQHSTGVDS